MNKQVEVLEKAVQDYVNKAEKQCAMLDLLQEKQINQLGGLEMKKSSKVENIKGNVIYLKVKEAKPVSRFEGIRKKLRNLADYFFVTERVEEGIEESNRKEEF